LHYYSKDFQHTSRIHFFLAIFSLATFYGLNTCFPKVQFLQSIQLRPAIALTIFGCFVFVFDRYLWKAICWLKLVAVEDYSGCYKGDMGGVDSEGNATTFPIEIEIKQTWSKMQVVFKSGLAESVSISSSILKSKIEGAMPIIWYTYFNEGYNQDGVRMGAHYGTTNLKFLKNKTQVHATYFTDQNRDSQGQFTLCRL